MFNKRIKSEDLVYRSASPDDAKAASELIFATFPDMATFIFGLGSKARAKEIIARIFPMSGHRMSYEMTEIVQYQGRVIGLMVTCPGKELGKLDRKLGRIMLKQYRFRGKLALVIRGLPLMFIKEASVDEYLLSHLAVKPRFRGRGVGSLMLKRLENHAREHGLNKVTLQVALGNQKARKLYERHGFLVKALHLESNKRVPYVGAGYLKMVKELDH